ncbi:family 43 glycosylhydrolase [Dactylosporangium sp. CS-033363]|uniref:glycoside hydrolase family 43 protein n=1 Tax=Dactylosporangium sp. CS-033363 TaxID=3239935 RepID=UPI003D8A4BB0
MSEPILAGFHPDPSVCRAGDEYFLVNSSFEYLPGVPVSASRDLLRWRRIGHVLDRPEQLTLASGAGSGGIFAPTLRYHGGRFWMVTTDIARAAEGHLLVWSEDPAGPWSTPVVTRGASGIDPDLAWDERGDCFLTWSAGGPEPIRQARLDPETGALRSEPVALWPGTGLAYPEGPHLYRRGDYWYLLLAEGGTERGHAVTVARSRSISGPFEPCPHNPILSHRSTTHPVQSTGHADLVETAGGEWAMVYLAVRPHGSPPGWHVNGRETFLAGVRWDAGWPCVDEEAYPVPPAEGAFVDSFAALDTRWVSPGSYPSSFARTGPDGLVLGAAGGQARLLAVRVTDFAWMATAELGGAGRLVLRLDERHRAHVELVDGEVVASATVGPFVRELARERARTSTVAIRVGPHPVAHGPAAGPDLVELGYLDADGFTKVADVDGRYLATEVAGGFTGRVVGVEEVGRASVVRRFAYRPVSPG